MTQNHFQVFSDENNQIQIVITGASAIAAATAVAECSTRREPDSGDFSDQLWELCRQEKVFLPALFRFVTN